jgi:hypothetical protein
MVADAGGQLSAKNLVLVSKAAPTVPAERCVGLTDDALVLFASTHCKENPSIGHVFTIPRKFLLLQIHIKCSKEN